MSGKEYSRDHCKITVAKILSTIGWHSINSTPLELLTDILGRYIEQIAKVTNDYSNEFGQTEPNLDHLGLAFQELGVNLPELEEYVTYVNFIPSSHPVPKFPLPKESNLNFLKPGSKEVVTRPVHINEHLPPMFPLLEEQNDDSENVSPVKKEPTEENGLETQFKKPADVSTLDFKKFKKEEENGRPTREITSVMMTTSGFLSPAREGKLPEAKAPAPPPEPPRPPSPVLPVPELVPMVKKKPEKNKKDRLGKELFKPLPDEKIPPPKKLNNMKDILKMKQIKAMMNSQNMGFPTQQPPQHFVPHHVFPGGQQAPPLIHHTTKPHVAKPRGFSKALADAKAKTEKLNTTITPIPIKSEPPSQFHLPMHHQVDKLVTEPDRKKINILRKISNVKDKHDKSRPRLNPHLMQQTQEIVNKINLSSDITIEPIHHPPLGVHSSSVKSEPYFDMGSPPGTPPTPRTPEIMAQPIVVKEKRKRKEKPEKPRVKRAKKQPQPHFIDSDILDMTMGRPKTPEAQLLVRHKAPVGFGPLPVPPTVPMPFPFLTNLVGGPSLIPPPLNSHLYPFSPIPDFGKTPYFPSPKQKPEPAAKVVASKPKEVKPETVDVAPLPAPTPAAKTASPTPREPSPLPPAKESGTVAPAKAESPKKAKEHKKEKKDKIKKKNKKEKVKDKAEKKKLKEAKKEKGKKEKKKKVPKEEPLSIEIPPPSVPRLLLKVSNPDSPRPDTPEPKKLNIKPVVKKEEPKHRAPSPGLAKISALVTGPPKPKNAPAVAEKPPAEAPVSPSVSRPPGRPRIHPPKPKPAPKRKMNGPPFMTVDADGKEIWYCPECKEENDERDMIGCDDCDAWYHWVCVGIQVPPDDSENWYCKPCLAKKNEDLQDKKKKRKKKEKTH